ncbi:MAG: right-handed parallel beta-helix repeat-containing protein [Candidatus Sumerlaeia bacterium]|nr:right-handed parallel beta-helix repeat-containing protein [Candidatus Sumerlaeia bacterium]
MSLHSFFCRLSRAKLPHALRVAPVLLGLPAVALPAVIVVTTTNDTASADGFVSLREAIIAANTDAPSFDAPAGSGADVIDLSQVTGAIVLNGPLPTITSDITFIGHGEDSWKLYIDASNNRRAFTVLSGTVSMSGFGIENATATGGNGGAGHSGGGGAAGAGGGIYIGGSGSVRIKDMYFWNCGAQGGAGADGNSGASQPGGGGGGLGGPGGASAVNQGGIGGSASPLAGSTGIGGVNLGNGTAGGPGAGGGGGGANGLGGGGNGGAGGFLAGGGAGGRDTGSGGTGGYGGGGGGTSMSSPGNGGMFGGNGGQSSLGGGGGGGAGLGGAIFVGPGAHLDVRDTAIYFTSAIGGAAGATVGVPATDGEGRGGAIFVHPSATAIADNVYFFGNVASSTGGSGFTYDQPSDTSDVFGTLNRAVIVVDTLTDEDNGIGVGDGTSLREAIGGLGPGGTVYFDGSLSGTSTLQLGTLNLPQSIEIVGPGGENITLDAQDSFRHFFVQGGTATISGLRLINGNAFAGGGGAILNNGILTVEGTVIQFCQATTGGAIANYGVLTVLNSNIRQNTGYSGGGGGIYTENATVLIRNSTIQGNTVSGSFGGGLDIRGGDVRIENSTISANHAQGFGSGAGGIHNNNVFDGANLTILNSTISLNSGPFGGGIASNGNLTIYNSTINNNQANGGTGGGGLATFGNLVTLTNSTINNNASSAGDGGGIAMYGGGLVVTNCTIVNNSTNASGGGLADQAGSGVTIRNTIIANNTASAGPDVLSAFAPLTSDGGNFIARSDDSLGFGATDDQIGTIASPLDPMLLPINDFGGFTRTFHPMAGSPVIDAGLNSHVSPINFPDPPFSLVGDQRGINRLANGRVDIGAVESNPFVLVSTLVDENDGDHSYGDLSLREATRLIAPGGTIQFDNSMFVDGPQTLLLDSQYDNLMIDRAMFINGPGRDLLAIDGQNQMRIFRVSRDGRPFTMTDLTLQRGSTNQGGGAIYAVQTDLRLERMILQENDATGAGILYADGSSYKGSVVVEDSLFRNNIADEGGGIYMIGGDLTVNNSTFLNNYADGGAGGAIMAWTNVFSNDIHVVNSTFHGNASTFYDGGAIAFAECCTQQMNVLIEHSTIVRNSSFSGGAVAHFPYNPVSNATIRHSIILGNDGDDLSGDFNSDGFNLVGNVLSTTGFGPQEIFGSDVSLVLDPWPADHGGPVPTLPLRVDGPAVDAGNPSIATQPATDARGVARMIGGRIDLGAYEAIPSLTVDSTDDEDNASLFPGEVTLREAIRYTASRGTVLFDDTLWGETIEIDAATGELPILTDKSILGPGSSLLTVSGGGESRVMALLNGRINVEGITIADGYNRGGDGGPGANGGGGGAGFGGGVYVAPTVAAIFRGVTFTDNSAIGGDGGYAGYYFDGVESSTGGGGGGTSGLGKYGFGEPGELNGGRGGDGPLFNGTGGAGGTEMLAERGGDGGRGAGGGGGSSGDDGIGADGGRGGDFGGGGGASYSSINYGGEGGFGGGGGGAIGSEQPGAGGLHGGEGGQRNGGGGGGGGAGLGGAVFVDVAVGRFITTPARVRFEDCEFHNNIVQGGFGGTSVDIAVKKGEGSVAKVAGDGARGLGLGAAVYIREGADVTFFNSIFDPSNSSPDAPLTFGYLEGMLNNTQDVYGVAGYTDLVVTTTADENDSNLGEGSGTSLREALAHIGFGGTVYFDGDTGFGTHLLGSQLTIDRDVFILGLGTDSLVIESDGSGRVLDIDGNWQVQVSRLQIMKGVADSGAIVRNNAGTLYLIETAVRDGQASEYGGGIWSSGDLHLYDSTVSGNQATSKGGGIQVADGGRLTLHGSTVAFNQTINALGGGIAAGNFTKLLVGNSTLSGNRAPTGGGMAIFGEAKLTHATITANEATSGSGFGGGLWMADYASTTIQNSILAANTTAAGPSVAHADLEPNASYLLSGGGNVIGIANPTGIWDGTDAVGTTAIPLDPRISFLDEFGGPTATHALLDGSPAIDNALAIHVNEDNLRGVPGDGIIFIDQRGMPALRIHNTVPDSGAFETQDYDNDGIPDLVENGRPSRSARWADGNGDGENDSTQHFVLSQRDPVSNKYVTHALANPSPEFTFSVSLIDAPSSATTIDETDYPRGWFDIAIGGLSPGNSATVDIYYEDDPGLQNIYGYGPTPTNPNNHLYDFNFDGDVGASYPSFPDLTHVRVVFTDGAKGDHSVGLLPEPPSKTFVNGEILHLGALGVGSPTLVELVSFEASTPGPGTPVTVRWETAAEIAHVGFHLHAAVPVGNGFAPGARLNGAIIPGEGTEVSGAVYTFVDTTPLAAGESRAYFLVDVDVHGKSGRHGPAIVTIKSADTTVPEWTLY